jgi:hypothetical protein
VVILSAFVPTIIAQQLFQPTVVDAEEEEALGAEDVTVIHHTRPTTVVPDGFAQPTAKRSQPSA